jgi:hypothetical protein
MAEWSQWQLRNRRAMEIWHRSQRGFRRRPTVKFPGGFLRQRHDVERGQFGKYVVRVLMIDQLLAVVGLARYWQ